MGGKNEKKRKKKGVNERIIGEAVMKKKKKGKGGRNKEIRKSLGAKRKVVKEENWRYWIRLMLILMLEILDSMIKRW